MTKPWHGLGSSADPVKRAHESKDKRPSQMTQGEAWEYMANLEDLVADLAALCEIAIVCYAGHRTLHGAPITPEQLTRALMVEARNPDGTRRWPGVGDE